MPTSAKLMPIPSPPLAYRQWFYSQTKSTIRPVSKSKTYENSWRRFTRKRKTTNQHRSNHKHSLEMPLKGHPYHTTNPLLKQSTLEVILASNRQDSTKNNH